MRISDFKKPALSGIVFFGTVLALSVGYGAYSSISSSEYAAGQPLSSSLFGKVVGNLEDLNAKISNLSFSGGNVGIGTANPTNKLDVNGYVSGTRLIAGQNVVIAQNSIALGDGTNVAAGGQVRSIEDESTPWLRFMNYAANVEWMRLRNGNLGIGTTSPVDRLHVKGDVSIEKSNGASRCRLTTYVTACSDGYASLGCTGGKCLCYYCY